MDALDTPISKVPAPQAPVKAPGIGRRLGVWSLGALMLTLAGCATAPDPTDKAEVQSYQEANDPIEPFNRAMFDANLFLDKILIKPIATVYEGVLPDPVRGAVRNFLNNFRTPVILANDLLQGEWDRAGTTLTRFSINTTAGIGGLMDPATGWGYSFHNEDFGQTLAVNDVKEGPYIFLPFLGPVPPRDLLGYLVDFAFDPLTYIQGSASAIRFVTDGVDLRSANLKVLDHLEKSSIDYYATIRSLYRQGRTNDITNGKGGKDSLPQTPGFLRPKSSARLDVTK